MSTFNPKKVVLAYSGGLDTSIILKWLQTEYGCEVVTFTADLGQGEELEPARQKAILMGIKPENIHIVDVREEFVRDFVFPMFRANAIPVFERNFSLVETYSADEAFLTGTFGAQTPVSTIDGRVIGTGELGPITQKIRALYKDLVGA